LGFKTSLRALGFAALAAISIASFAAPAVAAASSSTSISTAAGNVVRIAEAQRGKRYAYGAAGPSAFDCSGLVRYAYARAGVSGHLGGGHSGFGMLAWARAHHKFSKSNPQIGDVVIYGNGNHAAIYIGNGRVISALNPSQGIRITGLHALGQSVTGYIHTGLGRAAVAITSLTAGKARPVAAHTATTARATRTVHAAAYDNLRAGASTSSRVVAVVRPGTALGLIGSTTIHGVRWDHVSYRGHAAGVRANLVRAA